MAKHPMIEEVLFPPFEGFPPEALTFLQRLKKNNNRPWFQAHKEEYEERVRFPMQCLIATLGRLLGDAAPEFEFHPKRSIYRIYRDVRFSKNKAPYKTNVAATFAMRSRNSQGELPGLYVGIHPPEIFIGGGIYMPSGPQLKAIRAAIVKDPDPFLEIVAGKRFKKKFGEIEGERLQKAPLGYPKDHPLIAYLRLKQFYAGATLKDSACFRPAFARTTAGILEDVLPFVRWLAHAV